MTDKIIKKLPLKGDRHFVPKQYRKRLAVAARAERERTIKEKINEHLLDLHAINIELETMRAGLADMLGIDRSPRLMGVSFDNSIMLIEDVYRLQGKVIRCWKYGEEPDQEEKTLKTLTS